MTKFIMTGDFCEIVSDKFTDQGIKRGHVVYVAGHKALPISEEDPYTQRIKFFVHLYNPIKKTMGNELYLMDANSLMAFDEHESKQYLEAYKLANGID